ncbi:signal peptidase I [Kaarinaea lacus]
MHFDFPAIMVLAVLVTGVIWALDVWIWAPKRKQLAEEFGAEDTKLTDEQLQQEKDRLLKEPVLVEYSRSLFPVILIVLILRSFLIEPFRIPSGSMMPTLLDGDFILVNKFAYGIRLPVINTKIIDIGEPKRGDVAVFRYPKDPSVDYIKRVIGLPGDHIVYRNKKLYINGEQMELTDFGRYEASGVGITMAGAEMLEENLTSKTHNILIDHDRPVLNMEYRVGENEYFVMGDNRDNSNDSRFWGTVPEQNLVGKAFMIWMNWDGTNKGITWSRIGQSIE